MSTQLFKWLSAAFTSAVMLYFILWLLALVPHNVEGPATTLATPMAILINIMLVVLWGVLHSATARPRFKASLAQRLGTHRDLVRSIYILISGVSLLALCLSWQPFGDYIWRTSSNDGVVYWLVLGVHSAGWGLLAWAMLSIKPLAFWGLQAQSSMPLSKVGPYTLCRHPIQTGIIISIWCCPNMTVGHLLFSSVLTAYSVIGALRYEERDLLGEFGAEYEQYRHEYPAFIPLGKRRR